MFFTTKTALIRKDKQPINIHHIKDVNAAPWQKAAFFEILFKESFYSLESYWVADVMALVSNKLVIDMSAKF